MGPERLVVAADTIGAAQQRIFAVKAVLRKDDMGSQVLVGGTVF